MIELPTFSIDLNVYIDTLYRLDLDTMFVFMVFQLTQYQLIVGSLTLLHKILMDKNIFLSKLILRSPVNVSPDCLVNSLEKFPIKILEISGSKIFVAAESYHVMYTALGSLTGYK